MNIDQVTAYPAVLDADGFRVVAVRLGVTRGVVPQPIPAGQVRGALEGRRRVIASLPSTGEVSW